MEAGVQGESTSPFINRELSLLEFNRRVLEQAKDPRVPLLERLRFLTISSTNLDEFFEVRVARLRQQVTFDVGPAGPDEFSPADTLEQVSRIAHELVEEQYRVFNEELQPAMAAQGIHIIKRGDWDVAQRKWAHEHFDSQVLPVLSPLGLDPTHPFPLVTNKGLNFVVTMDGEDAYHRTGRVAVVQVPRSLPRIIRIPPEHCDGSNQTFVLLSALVHAHVGQLFPGMKVRGCHQFRPTRNGDLSVDEEEVDNLLLAVQGQLPNRRFGSTVRLEVADNCTNRICNFLLKQFELQPDGLYQVNGPVNLHRVAAVIDLVDRPDLKYPPFVPGSALGGEQDLFAAIRAGDLLLHHPFQAFTPVLDLLRQAASDPDVLAIKQTLYRTGTDSPVVDLLIRAAQAGKDVTVLVELRARFDEAANITLATRLQEAGANVVYGIVGHKAHAKILLIIRREGDKLRRYSHLGTGNYHAGTARFYTDFGMMTCSKKFGRDLQKLFMQLTGLGRAQETERLKQSPFTLHDNILDLIAQETAYAKAGGPAFIKAKMNSLTERRIIRALYEASQAGVQVDLIVRGVCRLRPGVPGMSENVRVRSVVGRFLEHHRVYWFNQGGSSKVYLSSADWMERNMFHRVETAWPARTREVARRVQREAFDLYLEDGQQSWSLQSDGSYVRVVGEGRSAQEVLMEELGEPSWTPVPEWNEDAAEARHATRKAGEHSSLVGEDEDPNASHEEEDEDLEELDGAAAQAEPTAQEFVASPDDEPPSEPVEAPEPDELVTPFGGPPGQA